MGKRPDDVTRRDDGVAAEHGDWGGLVWMVVFAVIVSLPSLLVLMSNRSKGVAKLAWFVLTSFFSWLAYAIFLIVAKPPAKEGAQQDVAPGKVD